ncbi:MAG: GTP cyclohydrolase II [Saprospiraceae bacterium]|nr:GTP cyclohydrolase II [Saprospiraceae bacterium]
MTKILKRQADAVLPTDWGAFQIIAYSRKKNDPSPHLAMVAEGFDPKNAPTVVRIHSECMTGDVFHSHRCDCGEQLDFAMKQAALSGGIVVYLRQEGRGIGLINKLKAYRLQDTGLNTREANLHLGFAADARTYEDAATILKELGVQSVALMTNNPLKINALQDLGITVIERLPILIEPKPENRGYLKTKKMEMGHLL